MIELVVGFVIAAVLLIAEYLLCTKLKSPLWGGIIPVLIFAVRWENFHDRRYKLRQRRKREVFPDCPLNKKFVQSGLQRVLEAKTATTQELTYPA